MRGWPAGSTSDRRAPAAIRLLIKDQFGLLPEQIAQQVAPAISPGENLAHDCCHHPLSALGDNSLGVDELLAAGSQALELFGFG